MNICEGQICRCLVFNAYRVHKIRYECSWRKNLNIEFKKSLIRFKQDNFDITFELSYHLLDIAFNHLPLFFFTTCHENDKSYIQIPFTELTRFK